MSQLKWCFGSLNESQEKEFIYRRLEMVTGASIPPGLHLAFTNLVSTSQKAIRSFALKNVTEMVLNGVTDKKEASKIEDAKLRASSTVSLRDIQRVFSLFDFFSKDFSSAISIPVESAPAKREALLLAIGIVYYMRLDSKSRMEFLRLLNDLPGEVTEGKGLKEVLDYAIDTVVKNANVPQGVALTRGLKENLFMTLVCALSRTPLMIVGPPGSSKVRILGEKGPFL